LGPEIYKKVSLLCILFHFFNFHVLFYNPSIGYSSLLYLQLWGSFVSLLATDMLPIIHTCSMYVAEGLPSRKNMICIDYKI